MSRTGGTTRWILGGVAGLPYRCHARRRNAYCGGGGACPPGRDAPSRWRALLEYVMGLMGLGWRYSLLVLGLIRDKGRLLRGQVSLTWESSKPL